MGVPRRLILFGAGALGVPAVLLLIAQSLLAGEDAAAILAGVPVIVLVVCHVLEAEQKDLGSALLPCLAALGGTMLLLPVRLPATVHGWTGFVLDLVAAAMAGICGFYANREAGDLPLRWSFRWLCLGNAAWYGLIAVALWVLGYDRGTTVRNGHAGEWMLLLVTLCCSQALAFILVRQLSPLRFATRFLAVPFVAAFEGYLLWRPTLSFRDLAGAVLMVGSIIAIFRVDRREAAVSVFRSLP